MSHNPEIGNPIVDDMTMAKKKEENFHLGTVFFLNYSVLSQTFVLETKARTKGQKLLCFVFITDCSIVRSSFITSRFRI